MSRFEPSPDLARFTDELTARFPDVADGGSGADGSGWAAPLERSDRLVVLHLSEDAPDALLEAVPTLAWQHDLVLFDPRAARVQAQRHIPPAPFPVRGLVRSVVAALVGLAIAVVAYLASIPLLSGLLVVVGGFVVVLALITLPALVADWRRSQRPTWTRGSAADRPVRPTSGARARARGGFLRGRDADRPDGRAP